MIAERFSMTKIAKRRGSIFRPRDVDVNDTRSPMVRLLQDGETGDSGHIEVNYAAQWPTFFKAQRLGLLDENGNLTEKGRRVGGKP